MAKYGTEYKIQKLKRRMLIQFKKQFKFKVKLRNNKPRLYISKLYRDEYITLFEYKDCLIHCRICEEWSKAYLGFRTKCKECMWNERQTKTGLCADWDLWSGRPVVNR